MMRRWSLGLVVTAVACAPAPRAAVPVAPPAVAVPAATQLPKEPPPPTGPLVLDMKAAPAGWLEPELDRRPTSASEHVEVVAVGAHAAILRTAGAQTFGYGEDTGVVGPLELPESPSFVGLGANDSVLVATASGELFASPGLEAARSRSSFERRASLGPVASWDAAADWLVAADERHVQLSSDGGRTWKRARDGAWGKIARVRVRFDGVLAVQSAGKTAITFVSHDHGASFARAAYQPDTLQRDGAWLWNGDHSCPAVLSENGRDWSSGGKALLDFGNAASWAGHLGTSTRAEGYGYGLHLGVARPAPPEAPKATERRTGRGCPPPPKLSKKHVQELLAILDSSDVAVLGALTGSGAGGDIVGVLAGGSSCDGLACLSGDGAHALESRTELAFFRDGRCSPKDVDANGFCRDGAHFERAPHLAVLDRSARQLSVLELPAGCAPLAIRSARGLGVVFCGETPGKTKLYATDTHGQLALEAELALGDATPGALAIARDGTLAVSLGDKAVRRALIRRPLAVGSRAAWRVVATDDALAYYPVPGGRALAVSRGSAPDKASFSLDEPGAGTRFLVQDFPIAGALVGVLVRADGTLLAEEREAGHPSRWFAVGVDAKHYPADK